MKYLPFLCVVACAQSPTASGQQPPTTNSSATPASAAEKSAALKATKAVNKLSKLGAIGGPGRAARDFTVTNPETLALPATACGASQESGTVSGELQQTKLDPQMPDVTSFQTKLSLTFVKCAVEGAVFDGGPFVQGVSVSFDNKGSDTEPKYVATVEMYLDGQLKVTGDEPGDYDFSDFHLRIGPVDLAVFDHEADAAAGGSYQATLNGSFKDQGETYTFNNEVIDLSEDEVEASFPDEDSDMSGGFAR